MRFWLLLGGMIAAFLIGQGRSHGATGQDALAELKTAMRLEIQQAGGSLGTEGGRGFEKQSMLAQVGQIRTQMAQGNSSYAQEILMRVSALFTSEAVNKAAEKAQAQLVKEAADRDAEFVKSTETSLREIMTAAMQAKSAAEIDPLIKRAGEMKVSSRGQQSEEAQRQINRVQYAQRFLQQWQDFVFARETGDAEKARNLAREMASNSDLQNFIPRSQLLELAAPPPSEDVTSVRKEATKVIKEMLVVHDPAELDSMLERLTLLGKRVDNNQGQHDPSTQAYLVAIARWAPQWQSFLTTVRQGRVEVAATRIVQARGDTYGFQDLPRTEIFQAMESRLDEAAQIRAKRPDPIAEGIRNLKTLDEMQAFVENHVIETILDDSPNSVFAGLRQLNQIYVSLKAGLPGGLQFSEQVTNAAVLAPLKGQLALYAVPRLLNIPTAQPGPQEGVWQFVMRLAEEEKQQGHWERAALATVFLQNLQNGSLRVSVENLQGAIRAEQTAQNMEKAGQIMLAVYFYNEALRSGGSGFPMENISLALTKIKAEHPQDYAEGNRQFLAVGPELAARSAEFMRAQMSFPGYPPGARFPRPGFGFPVTTTQMPTPVPSAPKAVEPVK